MQFAIESWNGRAIVFSERLHQLESSGYASVAIQDVTHLGLISLFWRDSPGGGVYDCWVSTRRPSAQLLSSLICSSEDSK